MGKLQVSLRDDQEAELQALSRKTGRTPGDFVRHGVDLAIAEAKTAPETQAETAAETKDDDWKKAWLAAIGMWEGRTDLDEMRAETRANSQRRDAELEQHWRRK
jgi:hypothetical protein